ncbi:MAG: ribosome biogenesis GTP-binding protein YihA/YsxC [Oscillospiraceae bacterium]|jgi:GTP-binding protein|nr:ribosome biogenesis GTP-binding protein YihA/YsxC [Oscillospiraceae bacterium]
MRFDNAEFEASYGTFKQIPAATKPEIVFSGRSNVGKSSLLNKILNRKALAKVSASPGKTVTVNFFSIGNVRLVDLPGYGYAKVSRSEKERWAKMIESYFNSNRDIRLVVQLIDMRHKPTQDDIVMLEFLTQMEIPYIIALTKSDKLNKTQYKQQQSLLQEELAGFAPIDIIPFSAKSGEGSDKIKSAIEKSLK